MESSTGRGESSNNSATRLARALLTVGAVCGTVPAVSADRRREREKSSLFVSCRLLGPLLLLLRTKACIGGGRASPIRRAPSIAERLAATAKTAHRQPTPAQICESALTLGRIILQRGDRGALNVLTRWLDFDLLHALAAHELGASTSHNHVGDFKRRLLRVQKRGHHGDSRLAALPSAN
jgi:hypothetical protein